MEETPRRRMERKSGSSSRSPSLSRRPSLKDKKVPGTIAKVKGKKSGGSGSKKERWLLTRKTWRYMSDAVGNLLPESHRSSSSGVVAGPSSATTSGSIRRTSAGGGALEAGPSSSSFFPVSSTSGFHSADIPGGHAGATRPKSMPTAIPAMGSGQVVGGSASGSGSKASSTVTSPTYGGVMSFPSHRPGVTPTGPGPGKTFSPPPQSQHQQHVLISTDKFYPPSDDIPTLEKHFEAVCNKEKRFLLWNRTKPKGLSGPALRELKLKQQKEPKEKSGKHGARSGHRDSSGSILEALQLRFGGGVSSSGNKENVHGGEYYSPTTEEDDDYDEYDDPDEVTVRERRKSSTASSTMSILGTGQCWTQGSLTFFRPLSTLSSHGSESSYSMILTPMGITKICRNTGTQTDPFPEELLIRFRLQAVQEERQQQQQQQQQQQGMRQISPDNQSDATTVESPMSPVRLDTTQKVSSPPPTTTASPMSPTTSTDGGMGRASSGSGRESQEKLLETGSSTRPSISGQSESMATTKSGEGTSTSTTTTTAGTDKKSEESGYSSSISDTVMRYLRMVRKNSKADNKDTIDKFKTVNYDRSLRYIKSKNVTVEEALEHEKNKEAQKNQQKLDQLQQQQKQEGGEATASPTTTETTVISGTGIISMDNVASSGGDNVEVGGKIGKPRGSIASLDAGLPSSPTTAMSPEMGSPTLRTQEITSEDAPMVPPRSPTKKQLTHFDQQSQDFDNDIPPSSPPPPPPTQQSPSSPLSPKEGKMFSPPPLPQSQESSSVGIQAGESLIRFLKNLNPHPLARKMSDFSSSCCSSDSPVDMFSPRYSFAATAMSGSDTEMFGAAGGGVHQAAMASMMAMAGRTHSGIPQPPGSGEMGDAAASEFDDVFQGMRSNLFQKQHSTGGPLSSSWTSSGTAVGGSAAIKKSSSVQQMMSFSGGDLGASGGGGGISQPPTAPVTTTSSSYSLSQLFHYSPSKSFRSRDQSKSGGGGGVSPETTSTPPTPTTSSIGGSSGGLMKTFFGSSPFSSTFGLKKSGLRKPTSTTSLTITTNTGSDSVSGRGLNAPPPTTSSSPNLLSLIQSSAASAGSGFTNLFSSSRSGSSITSTSASRGGGGGGSSGDFQQQPSGRAAGSSSAASSSVMQKSKSSSSVLPLYGSSGSVSGAHGTTSSSSTAHLRASPSGSLGGDGGGGGGGTDQAAGAPSSSSGGSRLISKSKLFKSRSKSSTRAATSSSGSTICTWSPQGRCKWKSVSGKVVTLEPTTVLTLSEVERLTLQDVALEKLRALNLGVDVKIPKEKVGGGQQKPKRRPYLLKKKALSTGFFESGSKREDAKESTGGGSGLVFGIALSQCVANDRLRQSKASSSAAALSADWEPQQQQQQLHHHHQQQHATHKRSQNGSRNSVSSVFEMPKEDKEATQSTSVPAIVTACINHLETFGLHTTGIFRVSTSLKRIRQLREDLDSGKEIQFGEEHSPHDVAALLKEFLRDLPEPLLCRDLYQAFLKTQKIRNRKLQLEAIQHLVQLLPVSNRDTLAALLKFFANVVANSSETRSKTGELLPGNKMEGYSLATLIAPNILPCMPTEGAAVAASASSMDQNAALTKERRESIDLVNYMISNFGAIFEMTPELLHDVYLHLMDTNPEAIEGILRQRCGVSDDGIDELETTSSVFEESEGGEAIEPEETPSTSRVYRRREEILHEGAGKGGGSEESRTRDRRTGRNEGGVASHSSGAAGGAASDVEKQGQSGGESDSSVGTRSTSRWFRRSRGDAKGRTSSDSGSEKVKGSRKRESSLFESKRASSLDSVNVQEPAPGPSTTSSSSAQQASRVSPRSSAVISAGGSIIGGVGSAGDIISARPLSGSDQSLRVPEHLMSARRQSSPVLESSGIITASLKIPVPVPLNIDDTDIPYIEDENNVEGGSGSTSVHPYHHHHHHLVHHQQPHYQSYPQQQYAPQLQPAQQQQQQQQQKYSQPGQYPYPYHQLHMMQHDPSTSTTTDPTNVTVVRCRSMSTDSSVPLKTTSSSMNTTPISSPARQPSSEISSPTGFSPPTSPPLYGTFPIEEMTARMLIGSAAASSSTPSTMTALSTSPSMHQFHHGAITMTTPSSTSTALHQYPSITTTKDTMLETKSAGSTPVTRPKIDKTGGLAGSIAAALTATGTSSRSGSISSSSQKPFTSHGGLMSLGVTTSKAGDTGTKSPSPQPPPLSLSSSSSTIVSSQIQIPSSSSQSATPGSQATLSSSSSAVTVVAAERATPSAAMMFPAAEPKGLGKETKGANIGGLIKSKTADFEKLTTKASSMSLMEPSELYSSSGAASASTAAAASSSSTPSSSSQGISSGSVGHHQIYSIAPKMRLRSQENVLLKQQFLLRQQQQHQQGESSTSRRERSSLKGTEQTTTLTSAAEQQQHQQPPSSAEEASHHQASSSGGGGRSITRRRLLGSASSSAIVSSKPSSSTSTGTTSGSSGQRVRSRESESGSIGGSGSSLVQAQQPSSSFSTATPTVPQTSSASSPSRWKRSEIIASRQQSQSSPDPETFV